MGELSPHRLKMEETATDSNEEKIYKCHEIVIPVPTFQRFTVKPPIPKKFKKHEVSSTFERLKMERAQSFKTSLKRELEEGEIVSDAEETPKEKKVKTPKPTKKVKKSAKKDSDDEDYVNQKIDDLLKTSRSSSLRSSSSSSSNFKIPKKSPAQAKSPASLVCDNDSSPVKSSNSLFDGRRLLGLDKADYPKEDLVHLIFPEPVILVSPYEKDDLFNVFILDEIKNACAPFM